MEAKRLSKLLKSKHLFSNIEVWRLVGSIPCGAWLWSMHSLKRGRYLWIEIASRMFGCEKAPQKIRPHSYTQSSHPQSSICFTFAFPNFGSLGIFLASDHILLFWNPLNRPSSRQSCLPDWWVYLCQWQARTLHHLSHGHGVCWEGLPIMLGCVFEPGGCSRWWKATYFQESCWITLKNNTQISKKLKKSKQKKPIWRFVATLFKDFIGFLSPSNIAYPVDAIPPGCELDLKATGRQGVGSHSPKWGVLSYGNSQFLFFVTCFGHPPFV